MPLLRKINKRRWDAVQEGIPWLPPGEFPAAPLADLSTTVECELSVWQVYDDRSNLEWVIAGNAANLDHPDKFDYLLFDPQVLDDLGIPLRVTAGGSVDPAANEEWHRDLVELRSGKIVALAKSLSERAEKARLLEPQVNEIIGRAIAARRFDKNRLRGKLRKAVLGE